MSGIALGPFFFAMPFAATLCRSTRRGTTVAIITFLCPDDGTGKLRLLHAWCSEGDTEGDAKPIVSNMSISSYSMPPGHVVAAIQARFELPPRSHHLHRVLMSFVREATRIDRPPLPRMLLPLSADRDRSLLITVAPDAIGYREEDAWRLRRLEAQAWEAMQDE